VLKGARLITINGAAHCNFWSFMTLCIKAKLTNIVISHHITNRKPLHHKEKKRKKDNIIMKLRIWKLHYTRKKYLKKPKHRNRKAFKCQKRKPFFSFILQNFIAPNQMWFKNRLYVCTGYTVMCVHTHYIYTYIYIVYKNDRSY